MISAAAALSDALASSMLFEIEEVVVNLVEGERSARRRRVTCSDGASTDLAL